MSAPRLLLIDNYDSFTYNLVQAFMVLGADVLVHRNDQITIDEARGAGKLVGLAARYRADGVVDRTYLEGDERIQVDDAQAPAWYGTGVEDLHDGGFYFDHGAFLRGLAGAPSTDEDGSGETTAYRVFATDPVVYSSALRVTQEAGASPAEAVPTCAHHVVHGYRRDQPLTPGRPAA